MMKDVQLKKKWKWKLNSHIYINYLINYNFINIFRVWISYKDEIIFTWDIIFDKHTFFDDKSESLFSQMITKINNLIIKVRLSEVQTTNESLLKEDKKILKFLFDSENDKKHIIKEELKMKT